MNSIPCQKIAGRRSQMFLKMGFTREAGCIVPRDKENLRYASIPSLAQKRLLASDLLPWTLLPLVEPSIFQCNENPQALPSKDFADTMELRFSKNASDG